MRDALDNSDEALAAQLDAIALTLEARIWQLVGHERPTDFAEWQETFHLARQHPEEDCFVNEATARLERLLFE